MGKILKFSIIIGIFLFIIVSFWFVYEYTKSREIRRSFSVTGEAKEIIFPNVAELNIGLISEGKDLIELQKENSEKFNKVIQFLKSQGIEERDIKTENYSITPKYRYDKVTEIVGYTISQGFSVKIRNLNKVGEILSGAVQNGANNIYGPKFTVDDEKVYLDKAREKAIKETKEKAEKIAKIAGFKLGKIVNITESSGYFPPPYPVFLKEMGAGVPGITPQIEPGSQEIKISVTITYEIK